MFDKWCKLKCSQTGPSRTIFRGPTGSFRPSELQYMRWAPVDLTELRTPSWHKRYLLRYCDKVGERRAGSEWGRGALILHSMSVVPRRLGAGSSPGLVHECMYIQTSKEGLIDWSAIAPR